MLSVDFEKSIQPPSRKELYHNYFNPKHSKEKDLGVELDDDALEYSRFGTWSCRLAQEGKMSYNYFKKGEPR